MVLEGLSLPQFLYNYTKKNDMKLHTKHDIIELQLNNWDNIKWIPKLYLDTPRIVISNSFEKYEQIHLNNDFFGSKKFLDIENEIDIMTFNEKKLNLNYLELGIPLNTKIKNNEGYISIPSLSRNIQMTKKQSFNLTKTRKAFYNNWRDTIILQYEFYKGDMDSIKIEIAQDFYLLNQDGIIVGWQLTNCCKYLCNANGIFNDSINNDSKNVLAHFFLLYTEETFEKMENQDKNTFIFLKELFKYARDKEIFVISDALEEWLEDNY